MLQSHLDDGGVFERQKDQSFGYNIIRPMPIDRKEVETRLVYTEK